MPIGWMIALGILLFLLFLLLLRLRVQMVCREALTVKVKILFLSFRVFPRRKKVKWKNFSKKKAEKKRRKKLAKEEKKAAKKLLKKKKKAARKGKEKPTLSENLELIKALLLKLGALCGKKLHLRAARLHIAVATGDAASTAVLYGAVSAATAGICAALDKVTRLRAGKEDICVFADYLNEKSRVDINLILSIRLSAALSLLISLALTYLKERRRQHAERKQKKAEI